MSAENPLTRIPKAIFKGMPAPLLLLISFMLLGILGFDLLIPDFVPFLDEAVFGLLLYGSISTLLDKRRGRGQLDDAPGAASEALPVGKLGRSLENDAKQMAEQAADLLAGGFPVPALSALSELPDDVRRLVDEVKRVDGFLSRKENDPWQVGREVERLERDLAEAEAEGRAGRMDTLQVALEGSSMHQREVADQAAARDAAVARMQTLSSQINTLSETLRVVAERGEVPSLKASLGTGWDPRLAAVLDGMREAHAAHAELEEAVADGAVGAAKRRHRAKA
jgi:hypothetical protein